MINHIQATIHELWAHFIGNPSAGEGIIYSRESIPVENNSLHSLLKKYFFDHFREPEFYTFDFYDGNLDLNPVYQYAKTIFDDPGQLGEQSIHLAKYLFENSRHPNIKPGDLLIAYIKDVLIEDEMLDALCLFKAENKEKFISLRHEGKTYALSEDEGIYTGKIDKGCIIFNTEREQGYKVCAIDQVNKSKDAQFWKEKFLNLSARDDDFHATKFYIQATKSFINDRLKPLYHSDKTQEAELLQRSLNYLKHQEDFNQADFDQQIFRDTAWINDFQLYKLDFQQENNLSLPETFKVSQAAVKNQSRIFKSILKLDKNFHIYIHGNRNMIEKGVDPDGRKYYKIYYEEEA